MLWLDVAGAPASGKSTLCDAAWPRKIANDDLRPPESWDAFIRVARWLVSRIEDPASAAECSRILDRYLQKIATVSRMAGASVYVNTGLAQAGLEIAWRLGRVEPCADFFRLMPTSTGVAFLWADEATLTQRNRARRRDRSHMVAGMERGRVLAEAVLRERGVPVLSLDTRRALIVNVAALRGLTERR